MWASGYSSRHTAVGRVTGAPLSVGDPPGDAALCLWPGPSAGEGWTQPPASQSSLPGPRPHVGDCERQERKAGNGPLQNQSILG